MTRTLFDVFLSATAKDLVEHRKAVHEKLATHRNLPLY